ncbi:MAG TPA: archaemetzincin family Zn-dependent metalloprotease [Nitrososphaeraceae archaeon]|nr:archaemetzincin family Zn-dependent metalloprotease [Nitrososphaeraceae archaeon]
MVEIVVHPFLVVLDNKTVNNLGNDISREFGDIKVTVATPANDSNLVQLKEASSFDKHSNQWDSFKILEWLLKKLYPKRGTKILGIFDIDAYSDGFDFVFGEAFYRGRVAAVYLSRIKQEFYSLKPNRALFYKRMVKESVHELGHTFGLRHCKNSQCVMYFSISLLDIDRKGRSLCPSCGRKYFKLN